MCVCVDRHTCCSRTPSRSWQLLLSGREIARKNELQLRQLSWSVNLDNVNLLARPNCFLRPFGAWIRHDLPYLLYDRSSSFDPYGCHFCQLWSRDDEVHHVVLRFEFFEPAKYCLQWRVNHPKHSCNTRLISFCWRVLTLTGMWWTPCVSAFWRHTRAHFDSLYPSSRSHNVPLTCPTPNSQMNQMISKYTMKSEYLTHASLQLYACWNIR